MNFQQLRSVREAVRCNFNLTEVAAMLFTSQPGVSRQIRELEDELGVEIFVRAGKRLTGLTPPGAALLPIVQRLLLDAENLRRAGQDFSTQMEGQLTVAATHSQARYALPQVVKEFRDQFPKVTLEQLTRYPIITYEMGYTGRAHIDEAFRVAGLHPQVVLTAMDADVIKTYVELGMGVGIVASIALDAARDINLRILDAGHLFAVNVTRLGSSQLRLEESHAALPGQLGRLGIKARCGVVVKAVLHARVGVGLVARAGGLEGFLIGWPTGIQAFIGTGVVNQQRGPDLGHVLRWGLGAVKRHGRPQIGHLRGQVVGDATAPAKANHTHMAIALGTGLQPALSGQKIGLCLGGIKFWKKLSRLVFVARVATQRAECVRRQRQKTVQRQAPGNVFDVRIQAPVFMHHQHRWQLGAVAGRLGQVGAHRATAVGRRDLQVARLDARIRGRHLLGLGELGAERGQQTGRARG